VTNKSMATCDSIPNYGGSVFYVDGGGSSLTVNGSAAPYQFFITSGGFASATTFSGSLLSIDGGGSQMQLSGAFAPAGAGFLTQLTVTNGGEFSCQSVDITNSLFGGVSGPGSLWNTVGQVYLGSYALLTVDDGGQVTASKMYSDSTQLRVQGSNSLVSAQSISIGDSGYAQASVEISQGGHMQSQIGFVGDNPSSSATVLIHDPARFGRRRQALAWGASVWNTHHYQRRSGEYPRAVRERMSSGGRLQRLWHGHGAG